MRARVCRFVAAVATISALIAGPAVGQVSRKGSEAEEKPIREAAEAFVQAFNSGDAKALAAQWTQEGEYIEETGRVIKGREEIEKEYAAFFKERPKARLKLTVESIRFVSPSAAIEEGTARLSEPPVDEASAARYSALHVKHDGKWLMASVRDYAIGSLSNQDRLRVLAPLIGDWTARSDKARVETSCKWMGNDNFIERRFTAYLGDEVVSKGFEIIGIDPDVDQIAAWHFSDDGGVGRSFWTSDGKGWIIEASGTLRDGRHTHAVNALTPVDAHTFTWHSYDRSVEGEPLPDSPIARITRNKKSQ